jgi:RNA polymerase sigma-70 factor, ECF subfamily
MSNQDAQSRDAEYLPDFRDRTEVFVSLLAHKNFEVHAYILTLLPNWADADEVLQRTDIILWRKFSEWRSDENFTAWACGIARYEVKNFLKTRSRDRHIFDDSLVDLLGDTLVDVGKEREKLGNQQEALRQCLQKLRPRDRDIIEGCYSDTHVAAKVVAQRLGRPVNTIYKALIRIRRVLFNCIQRTLAVEGFS